MIAIRSAIGVRPPVRAGERFRVRVSRPGASPRPPTEAVPADARPEILCVHDRAGCQEEPFERGTLPSSGVFVSFM